MKQKAVSIFKKGLEGILDLVYPRRCVICDGTVEVYDKMICPGCNKKLSFGRGPFCLKCGKLLLDEETEYCGDCEKKDHEYEAGRSLFPYSEDVIKSLYRLKYSGRREYAEFYGRKLAERFREVINGWGVEVIIPVPLHKSRLRERGYNQAALMAAHLGRCLGIKVEENAVIRVRKTRPQKLLDASSRQSNIKNAFKIGQFDVKLKTVLLVDDIYTTGSTIDEVCRTLKQAGAGRVYFLTAAAGC